LGFSSSSSSKYSAHPQLPETIVAGLTVTTPLSENRVTR
jgi:hypothetical protein